MQDSTRFLAVVLLVVLPDNASGFLVPFFGTRSRFPCLHRAPIHCSSQTCLKMVSDEIFFASEDPFVILGLDEPTADKKAIKRAYKKRALKFHPDVVTDVHSSPEEKKKASDRFSKINGAYEKLMGKTSESKASSQEPSKEGWTPPHRRSSSGYASSGSNASTDWRDYMPNYDQEDYDTGGDSFGQIFSDLFTGAASAAVSGGIGGLGGGIFNEFLEFLEGTGETMGADSDDIQLRTLLQTGTLEEVAEEMDDTQMVVQQLQTKAKDLDDEIFAVDAQAKMAARFSERLAKEEKADELKARKQVVDGYLSRAQKRLLVLQTRYKDLIANGRQSDPYTTSQSRSWSDRQEKAQEPKNKDTNRSSSNTTQSNSEESWMNEGFGGTSGRSRGRRGSGRRRSRQSSGTPKTERTPPSPPRQPSPPPREETRRPASSSAVSKSNYSNDIPPHRRTTGSYASRQEEDRKRMREVKVDEEFEKLKKELGL